MSATIAALFRLLKAWAWARALLSAPTRGFPLAAPPGTTSSAAFRAARMRTRTRTALAPPRLPPPSSSPARSTSSLEALREADRRAEYARRNYTWPIERFVPDTPGWRSTFERRFEQISRISDLGERYNGWLSAVTSAAVVRNYTRYGWGLTRGPPDLVAELRESLRSALRENRTRLEHSIEIIEPAEEEERPFLPPLFVDQPELNARVLRELLPMHSDWAGVPLVGEIAYGLRVYRNCSALLMHTDKPDTHVISGILHVDHSEDSEPWPIAVEDYEGNTHEVIMESGDLLLYESSKVHHGRPRPFRGEWYCSIFAHYYPVGWDTENQHWESHYAVPPHWFKTCKEERVGDEGGEKLSRLRVVGTGVKEPDEANGWGALRDSIKWNGPAIEGEVLTTGDEDRLRSE